MREQGQETGEGDLHPQCPPQFSHQNTCPPHCQSFRILSEPPAHSPARPKFPKSRESKSLKWGNHWTLSLPKLSSPFLSPTPVAQHQKQCITSPPLLYQQHLLPLESPEKIPSRQCHPHQQEDPNGKGKGAKQKGFLADTRGERQLQPGGVALSSKRKTRSSFSSRDT